MGQIYGFLSVLFFLISHSQVKVLDHFPVYQVVLFRCCGILLYSVPLMLYFKLPLLGVNKKDLIWRGFFGTIATFCYFTTLKVLPMATAVVLQQLSPLFAVMVASFFFQEDSHWRVYVLFLACLFGIVLIKGFEGILSFYVLLGLGGALFSSIAYNFVRKLRKTDHPLVVLSFFQYSLIPACLMGFCIGGAGPVYRSDTQSILILITTAFLAQLCLTLAFQKAKVSKVSGFGFLSIPGSLLIGYFFFEETLSNQQFLGIIVIFVSILVNQLMKDVKNGHNPKHLNHS